MKRAYVAENQVEAQLITEELQAAGIPAVLKTDTVAAPSIPYPSVWVDDSDYERARDLLRSRKRV